MKTKISAKKIAYLALMSALTVIFCFVPISFGPVTLALMILPTLLVAQTDDLATTAVMGLFMGLINYLAWFTTKAGSPVAPLFQNPLICILPRILIGVMAWLTRKGLGKLLLRSKVVDEKIVNKGYLVTMEQVVSVVSTAVGVMTNTVFVSLFTLAFFNGKFISEAIFIDIEYILAWFGLNFVIEVISFSLLVPPVVFALRKAKLVPPEKYYPSKKR